MKPTVPTDLITCSDLQAVLSPCICHACTTEFSSPKCLDQQLVLEEGRLGQAPVKQGPVGCCVLNGDAHAAYQMQDAHREARQARQSVLD